MMIERIPQNEVVGNTLQDQLAKHFKDQYPDIFEQSYQDNARRVKVVEQQEKVLYTMDIIELIEKYNIDVAGIEFDVSMGFHVLPVTDIMNGLGFEALPQGYGVKGGGARALLLRALGLDIDSTPRDIDIIRLTDQEPTSGLDDKVAKKYMPDDFEQGYGVEVVTDISEYMASRDFTINEVLYKNYSRTP